jgi:integrase
MDIYGNWIPEQDGGAANDLPEPTGPERPAEAAGNVVPLRPRRAT